MSHQAAPSAARGDGVAYGAVAAHDDSPSPADGADFEAGGRGVDAAAAAAAAVWTRPALVGAYALIWLLGFVNSAQQGAAAALAPYVASAFGQHSLTPTMALMGQIVGSVFKLSLAKVLDVFGRPHGFLLAAALATAGLALMAACRGVATYAAAHVLYALGANGLDYCLCVFMADTSSLRNRGLVMAYASSPTLVTAWLAGPLAEAFLAGPGFRWGFAAFAVATPLVALPLYAIFAHHHAEARRRGLVAAPKTPRRSAWQAALAHGREFDVVGVALLSAGMALVLVPISVYSRQERGLGSPLIRGLLASGVALLALLAVWESRCAPVRFMPYRLLMDRTMLGSCVMACVTFVSFFLWDSYLGSFLQVVNGLSVSQASYVMHIYGVGACAWALVVGVVIRRTGRFRRLALYLGMPLLILGVGLMIRFRQPDVNVGWLVLCQVLIAVAGGTLVICQQTAVMAAAPRQHVATVLAVDAMFAALGAALGLTAAAAVWQSVFLAKLREYLPASELGNLDRIYGRLDVQLSYPVGSPARTAIQRAYGDGQKTMLLWGTGLAAVAVVCVAVWRDIDVNKVERASGVL